MSKLHHQINMIEQKHTTSLTVVRNVFATDLLPNADTFKNKCTFQITTHRCNRVRYIDISTLVPHLRKN